MAGDITGSASHGARNTGRIAANTVNTPATANSLDTADTENPNRDRSRGRMPEPALRGCPRQRKRAV